MNPEEESMEELDDILPMGETGQLIWIKDDDNKRTI